MDSNKKYRLRVENCIGTIIDVHRTISAKYANRDFLSQFEDLKEAIEGLDMRLVSEGDVLKAPVKTGMK
ncbi:MAG: hypothetical protein JRJ86_23060 [Deltaproteobacteria bacterium]|nr:hypothetical protein [Deltaproteobacteria bacterium]